MRKILTIEGRLKDSLGVKNAYRHRGYRYDTDTGLYYLNARYYNAAWGRFINADAIGGKVGTLLSHNAFAYCFNNPVNMDDPSGYWPKWVTNIVNKVNNTIKWIGNKISESVKAITNNEKAVSAIKGTVSGD